MCSEPTRLAKPRPSTYTFGLLSSTVSQTLETLPAAAAGTASGSSRRSHPVKEKRGKRQEPAQMDSGSDSDGAPEELTAVQVRLVLSPRGPESRFTITYDLLVYSAQADDGYMRR